MSKDLYKKIVKEPDFKAESVMQGISSTDADFISLKGLVERVEYNPEFSNVSFEIHDDEQASLQLTYQQEEYSFELVVDSPSISQMFTVSHDLTPVELKRLQNAGLGLIVKMIFGKNNLSSFHVQVKLIYSILPNIAGIVDYNSYSILSGRWIKLAAPSAIPPSPSYLYRMHAVNEEDDVWLHTHGLNRCGSIELEILGAKTEDDAYQTVATLIDTYASILIEKGLETDEKEPVFIGDGFVLTWQKWEDVIGDFTCIGSKKEDREGHNDPSGVVYLYNSEEDYNNKVLSHPNTALKQLVENPLFFYSNEETARMTKLAQERIGFIYKHTFKGKNKTLIKAGLIVDDEHKQEGEINKEHLWFEVVDINKNWFTGVLLNQPYYISGLNEGEQVDIYENQITDWIIYTEEYQIKPDTVYLLDESKILKKEELDDRKKLLDKIEHWHATNQHNNIIEAYSLIESPDYELVSLYARALNNIGDFSGAIDELMKVKEQGEKDPKWHYKLAYAYESMSEYDKAVECLEKSLAIDETYAPSWIQLGYVYDNTEEYAKAVEVFEKAFEVDKEQVHYSGGEREYLIEMMEDCKLQLARQKQLEIVEQMEQLLLEKNYDEILEVLHKIESPIYLQKIIGAEALIALQKPTETIELLMEIKDTGEGHSKWQNFLGQAYQLQGKQGGANEAFKKAKELEEQEKKYVTIIESDDYISVAFYIEKERILKIGDKLVEINAYAYMNGYNWQAVIEHYVIMNDLDLDQHLQHDPEAGMYVGYFENNPENKERAERLKSIITDLVENEQKLYKFVEENGNDIVWE